MPCDVKNVGTIRDTYYHGEEWMLFNKNEGTAVGGAVDLLQVSKDALNTYTSTSTCKSSLNATRPSANSPSGLSAHWIQRQFSLEVIAEHFGEKQNILKALF